MNLGILILDLSGRVLSANAEARALLPFAASVFRDPDTVDLLALRPSANGGAARIEWEGVSIEVKLETMLNGGPEAAHLVLVLRATWLTSESRRRMLVQRFRMTPAEVRLAEAVVDGCTPAMAAERLGVTIHTVRTYLKRLYQKTGSRNQAGLVRTLLQVQRP